MFWEHYFMVKKKEPKMNVSLTLGERSVFAGIFH